MTDSEDISYDKISKENNNGVKFEIVFETKKLNMEQKTEGKKLTLKSSSNIRSRTNMSWIEKYRPESLDGMVCHKNVIEYFTKVKNGTKPLCNIILFGPPGTGKTSMILALAKQLYGPNLYRERVKEFNASDERGIEFVRKKIKQLAESLIGKVDPKYPCPPYKIIILDEADAMTQDAQSALRLIMEENSKHTRFVLTCNYIFHISGQIISRCNRFRFNTIDDESIMGKLTNISTAENIINKLSNKVLPTIIQLINGDLRKGITLLQRCEVLTHLHKKVTSTHIYELIGMIPRKTLLEYTNASKTIITARKSVKAILRNGYPANLVLEQFVEIVLDDEKLSDKKKARLFIMIAETEKKLLDSANEELQLLKIFVHYLKS